jgi:phosphopantetheinyl transferase
MRIGSLEDSGNKTQAISCLNACVECSYGPRSNMQPSTLPGVALLEWPRPVAFAAVPLGRPRPDRASRHEAQLRLVGFLLKAHGLHRSLSPYAFANDSLGRPILTVKGRPGPPISFTSLDGMLWGAVSLSGASVGIDAARSGEFDPGYPIHRAFHKDEFGIAFSQTGGGEPEAAALLWSVKEAAVKALGCAFHLLDPLELSVSRWESDVTSSLNTTITISRGTTAEKSPSPVPPPPGEGISNPSPLAGEGRGRGISEIPVRTNASPAFETIRYHVALLDGAGRKLGLTEDTPIAVCALRQGGVWLSVAAGSSHCESCS